MRAHADPEADPIRRARAAIRAAHACASDNRIQEARRYLREAEGLIPPGDPLWSDLHRVQSQVLVMESEYRAALDAAIRAVAMASERGTLQDRSRAYAALAHPAILPLLGDRGRRMMRDWVAEASETGDERLLIEARHFFVTDVWTRGLVDTDLIATAEAALHKAEEHGWTRDEVVLSMLLGWSCFLVGRWPEAEARIQHAHELVAAHGGRVHAHYVILLPLFRGNLAMGAGRLEEARQIFEEALAHAGFHAPIWLNHDLARCLTMLGDLPAAEAAMARALEARDRLKCIICGCQAGGVAAEFYATIGDSARAETLATGTDEVAQEIGHAATHIRILRARSRAALTAGDAARAVAAAKEAVGLGAGMPLPQPLEHGQSLLVLGVAQQAAGDHDRALAAWEEARSLFGRLGAAWHLRQVEAARQEVRVAR